MFVLEIIFYAFKRNGLVVKITKIVIFIHKKLLAVANPLLESRFCLDTTALRYKFMKMHQIIGAIYEVEKPHE